MLFYSFNIINRKLVGKIQLDGAAMFIKWTKHWKKSIQWVRSQVWAAVSEISLTQSQKCENVSFFSCRQSASGPPQDEAGHSAGPEGPAARLDRQEPPPRIHLLRSQPRSHPRDLPKVGGNDQGGAKEMIKCLRIENAESTIQHQIWDKMGSGASWGCG